MREVTLVCTCNALGAGTQDAPTAIIGYLYAIQWTQNTAASSCDIVVSTQGGRGAKTIMTKTNLSAGALWYPRDVVHDAAGGVLTGTSGGDRNLPVLDGIPRMTIVDGGNGGIGIVTLFYTEEPE